MNVVFSSVLREEYNLVSSTKVFTLTGVTRQSRSSLMYIRKSRGPRTEPRGTPLMTEVEWTEIHQNMGLFPQKGT